MTKNKTTTGNIGGNAVINSKGATVNDTKSIRYQIAGMVTVGFVVATLIYYVAAVANRQPVEPPSIENVIPE